MVTNVTREHIIEVAYGLFYSRGIQAVGMAELCESSGVSRKTFYSTFTSKDDLVVEVISRWHVEFMALVMGQAAAAKQSRDALLSVYDFLAGWFDTEAFRGCGFINTFGELGSTSPAVAKLAREHKLSFQMHLATLVGGAGGPAWLAPQLAILVEGAITTAAISGTSEPARHAKLAAETLIDAAIPMVLAA